MNSKMMHTFIVDNTVMYNNTVHCWKILSQDLNAQRPLTGICSSRNSKTVQVSSM